MKNVTLLYVILPTKEKVKKKQILDFLLPLIFFLFIALQKIALTTKEGKLINKK